MYKILQYIKITPSEIGFPDGDFLVTKYLTE